MLTNVVVHDIIKHVVAKNQIAENENLQQLSMMPGGQDYAMQAYLSGHHVMQLNMLDTYPIPDTTTLALGYVYIYILSPSLRIKLSILPFWSAHPKFLVFLNDKKMSPHPLLSAFFLSHHISTPTTLTILFFK